MTKMQTLVRNILTLGYLSLEAEEQLRHLLQTTSCNLDDLKAYTTLQQAAMMGRIRQQSREDYQSQQWMIYS